MASASNHGGERASATLNSSQITRPRSTGSKGMNTLTLWQEFESDPATRCHQFAAHLELFLATDHG